MVFHEWSIISSLQLGYAQSLYQLVRPIAQAVTDISIGPINMTLLVYKQPDESFYVISQFTATGVFERSKVL